jgi:hypothetical protein
MDRRGFLMTGGAALGGAMAAPGAAAAQSIPGRSVAGFGVIPDSRADQTAALQKAIDEIAASGEAVHIPGGVYLTSALTLPATCAITGAPGMTILTAQSPRTVFAATANRSLHIAGLAFDGGHRGPGPRGAPALIDVRGGDIALSHCRIENCAGSGIEAAAARGVTVVGCAFAGCGGAGMRLDAAGGAGAATVSANRLDDCAIGIALQGSGTVNGNFVRRASEFGIRLGGGGESGVLSATANTLAGCGVGLGVAAGEETMLVSLNLIVGARNGAIRAFHGGKLVGPDLARESAEAYLNLTVAGNVAR